MVSLDKVKTVINKISSIEGIREHICFFGGAMPYIYYNEESNREHADIDILVDKEYINIIRQMLKDKEIYKEELDSINYGLDNDYGLKTWIDGVYVEFEPMTIENNTLKRLSFSVDRKVAGIEEIPFTNINDLIIPIEIGENKTYCESMELIKAGKEKYKREKDLKDAAFIDKHGIDVARYERVKELLELSKTTISTYEEIKKKELNSMFESNTDDSENIKQM